MDIQRTLAIVVFSVSALMLWEAWQRQHQPAPVPPAATQAPTTQVPAPSAPLATAQPAQPSAQPAAGGTLASAARLSVTTDKLVAEIDTAGGDIRKLTLLEHKAADDQSKPLTLMQDKGTPLYVVQSGLLGEGLPTHNSVWQAEPGPYALAAGQDSVQVRLSAPPSAQAKVSKVLSFKRGSYVVDVAYQVENLSAAPLAAHAYFQFLRDSSAPPGDVKMLNMFSGPTLYSEADKFKKLSFSDIDKDKLPSRKANDGWLGLVQHYFVAAWLPRGNGEREFYTRQAGDGLYAAGVIVPLAAIAPGQTGSVDMTLYAGPQEEDVLAGLAPGLELVKDYGWLKIIAAPLFKLLKFLHGLVGNWGVAIILLTVFIKLLFYPLQAKAGRSMAQMKVLAPKLQKMKEQYGDDRAKLNQAMMELYKKEKINPLGGCLPIVIQIPVFIALYWVLLATVELRHAPFALWIKDLSAADPYFVMPLVMGATMFLQTKLNPAPPDPIQAKVMLAMPVVFTAMFLFFPAGLVLYWIVNNVLSIAQQWHINRMIEKEAAAKKAA